MACRPLPEEVTAPTVVEVLVNVLVEVQTARGVQHAAAEIIAKRQVDQVLHQLGGGWFYLPKRMDRTREARAARNHLALEMIRQGIPIETVVHTLKICRRTLYRIQGKKS